jgi:hypothetical protein
MHEMRGSFLHLFALGACGSNHQASEFVAARIPVTCGLQARCGAIGASEVQACIDALTYQENEKRKIYDVDAAVSAGRLVFDSKQVGDCLTAIYAQDCGSYFAAIEPAACIAALGPKVMPGHTCKASSECVDGTCKDLVPGCAATCVNNDTMCQKAFECPPDQYCAPGDHSCKPRGAAGAACDDEEACQPGLFCDVRPDNCGGSGSQVCTPLQPQNGWCYAGVGCAQGLGCQSIDFSSKCGLCQPWLDVGAQCNPVPLLNICPGNAACPVQTQTCPKTLPAEGDACMVASDCPSPILWCDTTAFRCKRKAAFGQACTVGTASCVEGSCETTTMTCQPFSC